MKKTDLAKYDAKKLMNQAGPRTKSFGAAEGLVLDRARPDWRKRYFENKFTLDPHFRFEK